MRPGITRAGRILWLALPLCAAAPAQLTWTELGPAPITTGPYAGRISAVVASPTDPGRYFVAGADGGVWRTSDGGASWTPVADRLPVTAIGALALDPQRESTIYAGSGEANFANHSRYGAGLYKSTDGGNTWQVLAPATFAGRCFARIVVDPTDSAVLFASVSTAGGFPARSAARGHPGAGGPLGIFKSTDGGQTFAHLTNGIPGDLSGTDVALDPANPRIVFAAIGHIFGSPGNGIYKSVDGGASFAKLTGGGLPSQTIGRIRLAVAPSRAGRVYALLVNPCNAAGNNATTLGAYRTDDTGATWSRLAATSFQSTYGWYLCTLTVHPTAPDTVFLGGLNVLRSTTGGTSFTDRTAPHVDNHAFAWDAAGRLLCGNDGGVHRSANLGDSWTALNSGLGTIQFYAGISLHPANADVVYGGFQDNGSNRRGPGNTWTQVLGGDGGYTGISADGSTVFVEFQGTGALYRSVGGGGFQSVGSGLSGRNCFLPPYELDPTNSARIVYGTERVFLSTANGTGWTPISPDLTGGGTAAIRGLAFAPGDPRFIYVATNDGRIQVTEDGGSAWHLRRTGVPGWSRVTRPFAVHPTDPRRAWLAVGHFLTEQILATADAGRTWFALDGNLPDVPAHCVALDTRVDPPILYLGTDAGVFRSTERSVWVRLGANLPNSPVVDLRVDLARERVVAATQGRGLWTVRLLRPAEAVPEPVLR
jgi:photosystem II stability/assembly factor-like uncharacterized protein